MSEFRKVSYLELAEMSRKRLRRRVSKCSVVGCDHRSDQGYIMKGFPKDEHWRALWVSQINRRDWAPSEHSRLCQVHFEPCMWESDSVSGEKKLKVTAIPTLFMSAGQSQQSSASRETLQQSESLSASSRQCYHVSVKHVRLAKGDSTRVLEVKVVGSKRRASDVTSIKKKLRHREEAEERDAEELSPGKDAPASSPNLERGALEDVSIVYPDNLEKLSVQLPEACLPSLIHRPLVPTNKFSLSGPAIRLKKLPFYEDIEQIIKPTPLSSRKNENSIYFSLTHEQSAKIIGSFTVNSDIEKADFSIQVQVRFCRLEAVPTQDDTFPPNVCLQVNGKVCPLPAREMSSRARWSTGAGQPVDVTPYIHLKAGTVNRLEVAWSPSCCVAHLVTVGLVRKLTTRHLLRRLCAKGYCDPSYTWKLIKAKLSGQSGAEVAVTSLRMSLACPLGQMRMTLPCRSSGCSHLQCFDARVFLTMNERRPTWLCPVCDQACPYDSLTLDGYFHQLLANPLLDTVTEIEVDESGMWSPCSTGKACNADSSREESVVEEIPCEEMELVSMSPVSGVYKLCETGMHTEELLKLEWSDICNY